MAKHEKFILKDIVTGEVETFEDCEVTYDDDFIIVTKNGKPNYYKMTSYIGYPLSEEQSETSADKIISVLDSMEKLLLYKNAMYGDSALKPLNIFAHYMSTTTPEQNGIYQRLDDKLCRVKNCSEDKPRINDVCDIIGYCTLLLVSMGVSKEAIEKLKD